ncbi:hypothetical protein B1813_22585 [Saccharomonospora piscinae]|uniref:ABC-2 type transport system permease protein n=1 Tax=Saccharomonospora piscinae TaxID=687388 RepID=A0A1V8ZXP2_SACPI|nr:hypothetical protein [Saccharomonospora piscinae]OQO89689.1 hypothetical protein B1813_22585 [Saccharomonospora piscinae]
MVGELIRLKLTLLRRSMSGQRAAQLVLGALVGLFFATGTIWLTGIETPAASVTGDLIAVALAGWMLGWFFGPILFGSGGADLKPEQFALFPIRPRTLTAGLVGAGLIGVGPLVTLVALVVLVVHGVGVGGLAPLVAPVGIVLTLVLVVLLSKVIVTARAQVVRSQLGAALSGLLTGALMAAAATVWAIVPAVQLALDEGFPSAFSLVVRALPSGWALTAVEAAGRSEWALVAAGLGGLLVADLVLAAGLARLLTRQVTSGKSGGRGAKQVRRAPGGLLVKWTDDVRGVAAKELRAWFRDVTRTNFLYFALFYGLLQTVTPMLIGANAMLPWTGIVVVVWLAAVSANLYASDGTALWLTLVTPNGERADVRGRQLAWLLVAGPIAAVLTVVFTAVSGLGWAWPWALALSASVLGAGAGAVVLVAVLLPVPMADPRQRGSGAWDNRIDFVQVVVVLALMALATLPTFAVLWLSASTGSQAVSWLAVPVGVLTGAGSAWWFGRLAYRRLGAGGAGLLQQLRTGRRQPGSRAEADDSENSEDHAAAAVQGGPARPAMGWPTVVVFACFTVCWVPLLAQGVLPMILELTGSDVKSWFLALWLPEAVRWPTMIGMVLLGLVVIGIGVFVARRYDVRPSGGPGGRGTGRSLGQQVRDDVKQKEQQRNRVGTGS